MSEYQVEGADLKKLILLAKKNPVAFGFNPSKTIAESYLAMHRKKAPRFLGKDAKDEGAGQKAAFGMFKVEGKLIVLQCERVVPALAMNLKKYLGLQKIKLNIEVRDETGAVLEADIEDLPDDPELAGEAGDDGAEDDGDSVEAERQDSVKPIWLAAEAKYTPLVARAVSEALVADPSKLKAAFAYAQGMAEKGNFAGAMKVVDRIKDILKKADGAGHSAKATFEAAAGKLRVRVESALQGRAGPFEKIRQVWAFAYGKAEASPPDFTSANKALAALLPLLAEAEKALEANAGQPDQLQGVREGTVEKRKKEINSGKELIKELNGMQDALKLAVVHQPDTSGEIKKLAGEVASAVSGNDLQAGNVALFKLENLVYQARKHRDREAANLMAELKSLETEISRLMALPPETSTVVRGQRALGALKARLPKDATLDNLTRARTKLAELKAAMTELKAEEPLLAHAADLREQAQREHKALSAQLTAARHIHEVTPAFAKDRNTFKSLDDEVGGYLYKNAWAMALAKMPALETAAKKLNARKGEFEQALRDEKAAADEKPLVKAAVDLAQKVPMTRPDAQQLLDKMLAEKADFKAAFKAKDWGRSVALASQCKATSKSLVAIKAECVALKKLRDEVRKAFVAVDNRIKEALREPDVLSEMKSLRTEASTLNSAFLECFNTIRDFEEAGRINRRLVQLAGQIEALKEANAEALARRKAFKAAYEAERPAIKLAMNMKPNTPEFLALYDKFRADYKPLWDAYQSGSEDAAELLETVKADIAALNAANDANTAAAKEAKKAATSKISAIAGKVDDARALINEHAPALEGLSTLLDDAVSDINSFNKKSQWAKLERAIVEATEVCDRIDAAALTAAPETEKLKVAFEGRWTDTLKGQITDVLGYEEVTPTMADELEIIEKTSDKVEKLVTGKQWKHALEQLDKLEPLVAAKVAFKPTYDQLVVDALWLQTEMAKVKTRVDAIEKMEAVTRDVAIAKEGMEQFMAEWKAKSENLSALRADWPTFIANIEAMEAHKAAHDAALLKQQEVNKAWAKVNTKVDKAREFRGYTPELEKLVSAFKETDREFLAAYSGYDYEVSLLLLPRVVKAADALIAKESDHTAAKAEASSKSSKALTALKGKSVGDLKKLDSGNQVALLEALRAEKGKLSDDQRAEQRKVYQAMELDPEFKKADGERRTQLASSIKDDEELMAAKDNWSSTPIPDRIRLLERTLKTECKIYGMPVPSVQTFSEPPGDEGFFDPDTNAINLNIHPDADFHDFYECIDTIVHENAHNYQEHLVTKLREGLILPGDPDYKQALLFAANSGPGDYVTSEEDEDVYEKQPLEEHAWATGGGIASALR